ncbi:MAG: CidA/LrgA family protein [Lachnospiraceae bacterium]|nr:CidA/LrgA family protein [Lachnospiraceae bacterium]
MKYLKQFGIIMSISFVGEMLNKVISLPIPASIYGIVILFLCLELKIIKVESIKETSKFLIEIMPIMFVPAAVGLIETWGMLKTSLVSYIVITTVGTLVVMIISGWVTQLTIHFHKKKEH